MESALLRCFFLSKVSSRLGTIKSYVHQSQVWARADTVWFWVTAAGCAGETLAPFDLSSADSAVSVCQETLWRSLGNVLSGRMTMGGLSRHRSPRARTGRKQALQRKETQKERSKEIKANHRKEEPKNAREVNKKGLYKGSKG